MSAVAAPHELFITGGSGYLGSALIPRLLQRGHHVRALIRPGSEGKLAPGCEAVRGDALDARTFAARVAPADTFVQLVGVAKPAPWKGAQFNAIDLESALAGIAAACAAQVAHFVYVSVAQPAPMMKSYIAVRARAEAAIESAGLDATILRPWYVLGPGHRWPIALAPLYALLERLPATRAAALRLGMVRLDDMVRSLIWAIEHPPLHTRIFDTLAIRSVRQLD